MNFQSGKKQQQKNLYNLFWATIRHNHVTRFLLKKEERTKN